jgi:actin-related protein
MKEIDLSHSSWLGGTVLPKLDSLRDLWIERSKYIGFMK